LKAILTKRARVLRPKELGPTLYDELVRGLISVPLEDTYLFILETALEDLLPQKKLVLGDVSLGVITSDSDIEMEDEEDQEPTPRPHKKNRNRYSSAEETDLGEDEPFRTPRTLKQKKVATEIITIDSSELSELPGSEDSEESESEEDDNQTKSNRNKTVMGAKGKESHKSMKVTIDLPDFFDADEPTRNQRLVMTVTSICKSRSRVLVVYLLISNAGGRRAKERKSTFSNYTWRVSDFQLVPFIDFSQAARTTSSNGIVASKAAPRSATSKSASSKSASSKSVASKTTLKSASANSAASEAAPKSAASQPTAAKSTAPQSKSAASTQHTTSKSSAPKSSAPKSSAPKSSAPKSTAPKSTAPKSTAPKSSQGTMTAHQDLDRDSEEEFAVGGMLDEDDSRERELALSSPLKGNELRAAKKVDLFFFSKHQLKIS
jgi:hypothetical protein